MDIKLGVIFVVLYGGMIYRINYIYGVMIDCKIYIKKLRLYLFVVLFFIYRCMGRRFGDCEVLFKDIVEGIFDICYI